MDHLGPPAGGLPDPSPGPSHAVATGRPAATARGGGSDAGEPCGDPAGVGGGTQDPGLGASFTRDGPGLGRDLGGEEKRQGGKKQEDRRPAKKGIFVSMGGRKNRAGPRGNGKCSWGPPSLGKPLCRCPGRGGPSNSRGKGVSKTRWVSWSRPVRWSPRITRVSGVSRTFFRFSILEGIIL